MFLAAPKKRFGFWSAFASTPPDKTFPECGIVELKALANRVIESRRITTSFPCSTSLFALSKTILATWVCLAADSSNVDDRTSPSTFFFISVTSSGRSSINRTIRWTAGWLIAMELAIFWSKMVLPALGGETISPRCPIPIGATKSMTLVERSGPFNSRLSRCSGYRGRRSSNAVLDSMLSGRTLLIVSIFKSAR